RCSSTRGAGACSRDVNPPGVSFFLGRLSQGGRMPSLTLGNSLRVKALLVLLCSAGLWKSGHAAGKQFPDGGQSPANAKGEDPQAFFVRLDGTKINALTFNFLISFDHAMGLSSPENAGLKLDLTRHYNSRVWYWQKTDCWGRSFLRIRRENPMGLG